MTPGLKMPLVTFDASMKRTQIDGTKDPYLRTTLVARSAGVFNDLEALQAARNFHRAGAVSVQLSYSAVL